MNEREGQELETKLRKKLRQQPALKRLPEAQFAEVMNLIDVEYYAAGDDIVQQNSERSSGAALFVILEGRAKVNFMRLFDSPSIFFNRRETGHNPFR